MPLSVGGKLGPYEILAPIGKGGMGEVYKARDTRLDRVVAIKVSAAQFSEHFEREAKAIGALNHSNICTLHDGTYPAADRNVARLWHASINGPRRGNGNRHGRLSRHRKGPRTRLRRCGSERGTCFA